MKFNELFSWEIRSKKLYNKGTTLQKEGIGVCKDLFKILFINTQQIFLIGNFVHGQLALEKEITLQIVYKRRDLVQRAASITRRLIKHLNINKLELIRKQNSVDIKFNWNGWDFTLQLLYDNNNYLRQEWTREFLLQQMGPEHIAKLLVLLSHDIQHGNAFKEIIQNWIPDNLIINHLVTRQLPTFAEKPLSRILLENGTMQYEVYQYGKWVKKEN